MDKQWPRNLLIVMELDQSTDLLVLSVVWPGPKRPKYMTNLS